MVRSAVVFVLLALVASTAQAGYFTWSLGTVDPPMPDGSWIYRIAVDPDSSQYLYAACFAGGVYWSSDGGASWHARSTGITASWVTDVAIHPAAPETIYACGQVSTEAFSRLYRSADRGATWDTLSRVRGALEGTRLAICADNPARMACADGERLYVSQDGGVSWFDTTRFTSYPIYQQPLYRPGEPDTIYTGLDIASPYGLYASLNGGSHWLPDTTFKWPVMGLVASPSNSNDMFAGCGNSSGAVGGLRWSRDGGLSWPDNQSWDTTATVPSVVLNPQREGMLWVAVEDGNYVYQSVDTASNFAPMNNGLTPGGLVFTLTVAATDSLQFTLYAGTRNGELWSFQGIRDIYPPVFSNTTIEPESTTARGPYLIFSDICDSLSGLNDTLPPRLHWRIEGWTSIVEDSADMFLMVPLPCGATYAGAIPYLPDSTQDDLTVHYWVSAIDKEINRGTDPRNAPDSSTYTFTVQWVGIEEGDNGLVSGQFNGTLLSAWPNPTPGRTELRYGVPGAGRGSASLEIYNVLGQKVRTLVSGPVAAGMHSVSWDGRDLNQRTVADGIYFARYWVGSSASGRRQATQQLIVLR